MNSRSVIAETLARMGDDELVERWKRGIFSDEARPIAAAEFRSRGIDPDTYVTPIEIPSSAQVSDFSSSDRPFRVQLLSFKGRASRTGFWLVVPASWVSFVVLRLYFEFNYERMPYWTLVLTLFALLLPVAWLHWATVVQRLHDRNKSGAWSMLLFIPVVGMVWAIIELGCLPGTRSANRYGKR